jgi:hypothetical protein
MKEQGVKEATDMLGGDNFARELLGLVIMTGVPFAIGTFYSIKNKLNKYQGQQIIQALERKGVTMNRDTHSKVKPILDKFDQAVADNDGEQAKALANQIEQMIIMGKLSAPAPQIPSAKGKEGMAEEEQKPAGWGEFPPKQEITIVPPKKLKSGETYQDRNKYWQSQGQAPIYKTNEAEGVAETALNPRDPAGDYAAKRKALQDLGMNKDVDQKAVLQRRLDLDREAKAKGVAEVSDTTLKNYKRTSAGDAINRQNVANRSGAKDPKIAKRNAGQERAEKKLQGMAEMDKSQKGPAGWNIDDYDYSKGKWTQGKPVTAKAAVKSIGKELNRAFDRTKEPEPTGVKKKNEFDIKEGGYNNYDNNRTGFGKRPREDDEYHVPDPVETEYNIKVNGQVINHEPFANRAAALAWAKQAVADGKLDPKNAKLSPVNQVNELSTEKLAQYKKAAGADASAADKRGDFEQGNKRFRGINKATMKQFDNDAKKHKEQGMAEGKMKDLAYDLNQMADHEFREKYGTTKQRWRNQANTRRPMSPELAKSPHIQKMNAVYGKPYSNLKDIEDDLPESAMKDVYADNQDAVYSALTRRVLGTPAGHFLIKTYGLDRVMDAMQEVADFHGDVEEIGSSDVSAYMRQLQRTLESNR